MVHGNDLGAEEAKCSAMFRRQNITGQKLKVNDSHQILKAFYNSIVDLLHYEQIEQERMSEMKIWV